MFMRPSGRHSGVAQALMDLALSSMRTDGYDAVWLETAPMLVDAQRLYNRLGFQHLTGDAQRMPESISVEYQRSL